MNVESVGVDVWGFGQAGALPYQLNSSAATLKTNRIGRHDGVVAEVFVEGD
jgi:hypothetical protein